MVAAPGSRHASVHAEHVGSLLRPAYLLDARARHRAAELTEDALRAAEDRAALEAIDVQRAAGIGVFTDGEVRRESRSGVAGRAGRRPLAGVTCRA